MSVENRANGYLSGPDAPVQEVSRRLLNRREFNKYLLVLAGMGLASPFLGACANAGAESPEGAGPVAATAISTPASTLKPENELVFPDQATPGPTESILSQEVVEKPDKTPTPYPGGGSKEEFLSWVEIAPVPEGDKVFWREYAERLEAGERLVIPGEVILRRNAVMEAAVREPMFSQIKGEMRLALFNNDYGVVWGDFPQGEEGFTPSAFCVTKSVGGPADNTEIHMATSTSLFPGALIGAEGGLPQFAGLVGVIISPTDEVLGTTWQTELGLVETAADEEVVLTVGEETTPPTFITAKGGSLKEVALIDSKSGNPGSSQVLVRLDIDPKVKNFLPEGDVRDALGGYYGSLKVEVALEGVEQRVEAAILVRALNLRESGPETEVLTVLGQNTHEVTPVAISPDGKSIKLVAVDKKTGGETIGWVAAGDGETRFLKVKNWHALPVEKTVPPTPEPTPIKEEVEVEVAAPAIEGLRYEDGFYYEAEEKVGYFKPDTYTVDESGEKEQVGGVFLRNSVVNRLEQEARARGEDVLCSLPVDPLGNEGEIVIFEAVFPEMNASQLNLRIPGGSAILATLPPSKDYSFNNNFYGAVSLGGLGNNVFRLILPQGGMGGDMSNFEHGQRLYILPADGGNIEEILSLSPASSELPFRPNMLFSVYKKTPSDIDMLTIDRLLCAGDSLVFRLDEANPLL